MIPGFEIMIDKPLIGKAEDILRSVESARPKNAVITAGYSGQHKVLIMYGAGAPWRVGLVDRHIAAGGFVVCLDLPYWGKPHAFRLAFNSMHPTEDDFLSTPITGRSIPALREDYCETGPIIVIGMGRKSREQHGYAGPEWEMGAIRRARDRFPGRRILYRKKGAKPDGVACPAPAGEKIEDVIRGASLIICRHSNVAVDACIAGIPVECEGGAAKWLYQNGTMPSIQDRLEFLGRLAHWQYRTNEAAQAWQFIRRMTEWE